MKKKKIKNNLKNRKKFKKENRKNFLDKLHSLQNSINNFSKCIPLYNIFSDKNNVDTSSFFDMTIYNSISYDNNNYTYDLEDIEIPSKIYKCKKICLKPDQKQTKALLNMLEGYRLVYNLTLSFIKTRNYLYKKEQKNKILLEQQKQNIIIEKPKKEKLNKEQREKIKIEKKNQKEEKEKLKKEIDELKKNMTKEEHIEEMKKKRIEKISRVTMENNNEPIFDYKIIRTYFLKNDISKIAEKYKTPIHTLDKAVALACSMYKSAISNLASNNISNFKIRPIKKTKSSLIMDIEKTLFTKDGKSFIKSILGNEVKNKNNFDYSEIKNDCKIHYNTKTKLFILLVPEEINIEKNNNNNYISIDPGLRTFLNCMTNNSYIEIGSNIRNKIEKELKMLDKRETIKNSKRRRRYVNIMSERMKNQINDTHWKIINYLTKTYKTIVIGKWSTKSVISKENSVLRKIDKRVLQKLSFYQFLERLKYKCLVRDVNIKIVEEHYTSKVCTNCGNYNKELKGDKIYKCEECKEEIKRDYNGARNIFIKSIKTL